MCTKRISRSLRSQTLGSTSVSQLLPMFLPPMVAFGNINTWSQTARAMLEVTLESCTCSWTQLEPLPHVLCQTAEPSETNSKTLNINSGWKKSSSGALSLPLLVTDLKLHLIVAHWAGAYAACLASLPPMMVVSCTAQEPTGLLYGRILGLITQLSPHTETLLFLTT